MDDLELHARIIWAAGRDGIERMPENMDVNVFILSLLQRKAIFHVVTYFCLLKPSPISAFHTEDVQSMISCQVL